MAGETAGWKEAAAMAVEMAGYEGRKKGRAKKD
jgi:hypothetical protein